MPQPTVSQVHVNRPLTNISVAFAQAATSFAAERVFPRIPVAKQSDRYFVYSREDWLRADAKRRAECAESAGSGFNIDSTPNYFCELWSIHKDVSDNVRANSDDGISPDRDATEYVTEQLLMAREKVFVEKFMDAGIWDVDWTGVAGVPGAGEFKQWNDDASTPIEDITLAGVAMAGLTGKRPNVIVCGPSVLQSLKNHPDVLDRIKYTEKGIVTADLLASLMEVEEIVVPWGVTNSATEDGTEDTAFITDKTLLLAYREPNPGLMKASAGYIFVWTGLLGAGAYGGRIKRFPMEQLGCDRIEGDIAFDQKVVAPELGTFFATAVA